MSKWQLIETAPKDEESILLYYPDVGVVEGYYFSSPKQLDDGWFTIFGAFGEPTRWQPLPPPPKEL